MAKVLALVDEVVGIMSGNVEKVLERDQKLTESDRSAEETLQHGTSQSEHVNVEELLELDKILPDLDQKLAALKNVASRIEHGNVDVNKVKSLELDSTLTELHQRAEALEDAASQLILDHGKVNVNAEKVSDDDQRLEELDQRTEALESDASQMLVEHGKVAVHLGLGHNLTDLERRADALQDAVSQFNQVNQAKKRKSFHCSCF